MRREEHEENPYLSARAEYGDRYGAAVNEAARWRQISFFLLLLCLAFGGMMMWMANQNKVVPYVVQVDKQGYSVAIKSAEEVSVLDNRVVIAALSRFFSNFKTIVTDTYAQRAMVNDVYSYIARGSSAEGIVTNYYRNNSPFTGNASGNITQVEVKSILAVGGGGKSWQVLWTESMIRRGEIVSSSEWRAIVTIEVYPHLDLANVMKNPLGIYISELNMAQDVMTSD